MILVRITPFQFKELGILKPYVTQEQITWVSLDILALELEDPSPVLSMFTAILQEGFHKITVLTTYQSDDFSVYLLNLLHQTAPGKIYSLAEGFFQATLIQDPHLHSKASQLYSSLPSPLMDVVLCYCRNQGSLLHCAQNLYLHRNTVNHKINVFIEKTGMDLRKAEVRNFLTMLKIMLFGV